MSNVAIYSLDRGFQFWRWLCPFHVRKRKAAGFEVSEPKKPPHPLTCDDCR